jgi:hypothetical protein
MTEYRTYSTPFGPVRAKVPQLVVIQEMVARLRAEEEAYVPPEDHGLRQGDIRVCRPFPEVEWTMPEMDDEANGVGEGWVRARNGFGTLQEVHPDWAEEKWVLVVGMADIEHGVVSVLMCGRPDGVEEDWLTDYDIMVSAEETGGRWSHPVYCNLRAPVFTHQLGELKGRLDDLSMVRAASQGAVPDRDVARTKVGLPLRSKDDPRRAWKLGLLHVLHRLASGCTQWLLDDEMPSEAPNSPPDAL